MTPQEEAVLKCALRHSKYEIVATSPIINTAIVESNGIHKSVRVILNYTKDLHVNVDTLANDPVDLIVSCSPGWSKVNGEWEWNGKVRITPRTALLEVANRLATKKKRIVAVNFKAHMYNKDGWVASIKLKYLEGYPPYHYRTKKVTQHV
jgi:hypothetical protein